jgi:hypothetical protein
VQPSLPSPKPGALRALRAGSEVLRADSRRLRAESARLQEASRQLCRHPSLNGLPEEQSAQDGLGERQGDRVGG